MSAVGQLCRARHNEVTGDNDQRLVAEVEMRQCVVSMAKYQVVRRTVAAEKVHRGGGSSDQSYAP